MSHAAGDSQEPDLDRYQGSVVKAAGLDALGAGVVSKFLDGYQGSVVKSAGLDALGAGVVSKFLDGYTAEVNAQLAAAGVFTRVTPARFRAIGELVALEANPGAKEEALTTWQASEAERATARMIAQILTTVIAVLTSPTFPCRQTRS